MRFRLLSPENYERLVSCRESTAIGGLPAVFRADPALDPQQVIQDLDWLTRILRDCIPEYSVYPLIGHIGCLPFDCQERGHGDYGRVFRLRVAGESFALKVYKDPGLVGWHGSIGEVCLAAFFAGIPVSDAARFYLGDPVSGWMLSEWIDPATVESRVPPPGPTVESVAREYGLTLRDHFEEPEPELSLPWDNLVKDWRNWGPGGILIDYGGIRYETPATPEEFEIRLRSPHYRTEAWELFFDASKVLPFEQRWAFFQKYAQWQDIWGIIEDHLTTAEQLGVADPAAAFDEAIARPESQVAAAWLVRFLEADTRIRALETALFEKNMDPLARAYAASQLDFLEDVDAQRRLFRQVLETQPPKIRRLAVLMLPRLYPSLHAEAFHLALDHGGGETFSLLPWFIHLLPPESRKDAFLALLEKSPAAHEALAEQLAGFPARDVRDLIARSLAFPTARRAMSRVLGSLPLEAVEILAFFEELMVRFPDCRRPLAEGIGELPGDIRFAAFQRAVRYAACRQAALENLLALPPADVKRCLPDMLARYPQHRTACVRGLAEAEPTRAMLEACLRYAETRPAAVLAVAGMKASFREKLAVYQDIVRRFPELRRAAAEGCMKTIPVPLLHYGWAHQNLPALVQAGAENLSIRAPSAVGLLLTSVFVAYNAAYGWFTGLFGKRPKSGPECRRAEEYC